MSLLKGVLVAEEDFVSVLVNSTVSKISSGAINYVSHIMLYRESGKVTIPMVRPW